MRPLPLRHLPPAALGAVVFALIALSGCNGTDTIIYRDRPPFNPPPDSTSGFLGYYTAATKQTTCGNCHVGTQAQWATTKHARAYTDLVASGAAQPFCYSCHTVSENGNTALAPAGWNAVESNAYRDVQCENCHGPGLAHVTAPDNRNNWPLAHIRIDTTSTDSLKISCGACHSGAHEPFVEEWSKSPHGQVVPAPSKNASCVACHEARGTLTAWGVLPQTNFVELTRTDTMPTECAVCHDPHGSPYEGQLRFPIDNPDPTVNLCMKCHNRSTLPSASFSNSTATVTRRGAHAPQGPVLLGEGTGYIPAGFIYDTVPAYTSHASTNNPRLCAGCHRNRYLVTDPTTGGFVFNSTGHLFLPIPCLDPVTGLPTAGDCAYNTTARTWAACTKSGCHASENVAMTAFTNKRQVIQNYVNTLWTDDGVLNTGSEPYMDTATDTGYLVQILAANPTVNGVQAFNATDNILSPAEGALYNVLLLSEDRYSHRDGSKGVHNPFFYEALLAASTQELLNVYAGVIPAPPAPLLAQIQQSMQKVNGRFINLTATR